jgi:hypothetical protein
MRRIARLLAAAGASTAALLAFGAAAAPASTLAGCSGSGTLYLPTPSSPTWGVTGGGSCPLQTNVTAPIVAHESTTVHFSGAGTSDSLGLCSGTLLVTNLKLNVDVTVTGEVTGNTVVQHQIWSAAVTTFPLATEFLISSSSGPPVMGAGIAISHIYLNCGNDGNKPSAQFLWLQNS